jgi:hypothetical protein
VQHWNGSTWRSVSGVFPNGYEINAIDAVSSNDVWAVGESLTPQRIPTLFEYWDGTAWHAVTGPPGSDTGRA